MNIIRYCFILCLALLVACTSDAEQANRLYVETIAIIKQAGEADYSEQITLMKQAKSNYETIINDYPGSDLAVLLSEQGWVEQIERDINTVSITFGINLMSPVKYRVADSYLTTRIMPANHAEADLLDNPTDYAAYAVSGIGWTQTTASTGYITITYDDTKLGQDITPSSNTLVFSASGSANAVTWDCKRGTLPDKYRPQNCRG